MEKLVQRRNHDKEVHQILLDNNGYDPQTQRLIKWNGPEIVSSMIAQGHTHLDFNFCDCRYKPNGDKRQA